MLLALRHLVFIKFETIALELRVVLTQNPYKPIWCWTWWSLRVPSNSGYSMILWFYDSMTVHHHSQVLLCLAALQPLISQSVALLGVIAPQLQDPALGLVELHAVDLSPSVQPIQILLQSLRHAHLTWCHLRTYWGFTQCPRPDHWWRY